MSSSDDGVLAAPPRALSSSGGSDSKPRACGGVATSDGDVETRTTDGDAAYESNYQLYMGVWRESRNATILSGVLSKSSGKKKLKGFDVRYFILTAAELRYWKDEKGYVRAPTTTLKGTVDIADVCEVNWPSSCTKLKDATRKRGAFDVCISGADGARVLTLFAETAAISAAWYSALTTAFLAHPRTLRARGIVPPTGEPPRPREPDARPSAYAERRLEPDVARADVARGDVASAVVMCLCADAEELFVGFATRGVFQWSDRRGAFEALDRGAGTAVALVRGRQDPSLLLAAYSAAGPDGMDVVRHWTARAGGSVPILVAEMILSQPGSASLSLMLNESRSLLLVLGPTYVEVWSYVSHSMLNVLACDAALAAAVVGNYGELLFTACADEDATVSVWSMTTLLFERALSGHAPNARFSAQSLLVVSDSRLATGASDNELVLWDTIDLEPVRQVTLPTTAAAAAAVAMTTTGAPPPVLRLARKRNALVAANGLCVSLLQADSLEVLGRFDIGAPALELVFPVSGNYVFVLNEAGARVFTLDGESPGTALFVVDAPPCAAAGAAAGAATAAGADAHDTAPSLLARGSPLSRFRTAITVNSLFFAERGGRELFELCFIEEKLKSAERQHANLARSNARWCDDVARYSQAVVDYKRQVSENTRLTALFAAHMAVKAPI